MSLSKKKDSPFWYTRFTISGIRVQESTKTTSRAEAEEYEEKRRREIRQQVLLGKKPRKTWPQAEYRWLTEMEEKRSLQFDIKHFEWLEPHLKNFHLDEITKNVIEDIAIKKESEGVKPATVNRMLALIRAVLNKAYKQWDWLDSVPFVNMRKENNARIRWLTREEANKLLNELPTHLNQLVRFSLATGLRQQNVLKLKWESIDLFRSHLVINADDNKTKKFLGIPLNNDALQVLNEVKGNHSEYVFTYKGEPINQCNTKAWKKALKRSGIKDFRWHDLRHTWASWHVQNGTSLQELCELGGWHNITMVLRYAHLSARHLKNAAHRIDTIGAELVQPRLRIVGSN